MTNTVLLSAMTMIALTGITLTSLKYQHDNAHSDVVLDLDDDADDNATYINPKFHFYAVNRTTEKTIVKRSNDDNIQYLIDDKNVSRANVFRRERVKQVQALMILFCNARI